MTRNAHLEACPPCRELDRLWDQLFGDPSPEKPQAAEPEWKTAAEQSRGGRTGVAGRPGGRAGWGRPLAPENTCPECGKWKNAKYATCFGCSGMVLCEECGERYHSEEYDVCYECAGSPGGWEEWDE